MALQENEILARWSIEGQTKMERIDQKTGTRIYAMVRQNEKDSRSVTRFGKISPLWQNFKGLWQFVKGLFKPWQIPYVIGLILFVVNGQISKKVI